MEIKAKWLLRIAGIYGLLVLTPMYFLEAQIGRDQPPAITHPEFFYGFLGVGIAWQFVFLIMSTDPVRYRALLPAAVLEKAGFGIATMVLAVQGRVGGQILAGAAIDLVLGVLFVIASVGLLPGPKAEP